MTKNATLHMRIDQEIKQSAEQLFSSFGITITDAINMFLRQSVKMNVIPLDINATDGNDVIVGYELTDLDGYKFWCPVVECSDEKLERLNMLLEDDEDDGKVFDSVDEMFNDMGITFEDNDDVPV